MRVNRPIICILKVDEVDSRFERTYFLLQEHFNRIYAELKSSLGLLMQHRLLVMIASHVSISIFLGTGAPINTLAGKKSAHARITVKHDYYSFFIHRSSKFGTKLSLFFHLTPR